MSRDSALRAALIDGAAVSDDVFDRIYPDHVAELSATHFTPVAVARRAAQLLVPAARVLDVGAGAGKACIIGSLTTDAEFTGVEQRGWLAEAAREAAARLWARARFLVGDALELDWSEFDGIYLFNPFYENLDPKIWIDRSLPLGRERHTQLVTRALACLGALRPGARVVVYHGLGADRPAGLWLEHREKIGADALEVWVRSER